MAYRNDDRRRYRDDPRRHENDRYREHDSYYRQADQFAADDFGQQGYAEGRHDDWQGGQMGDQAPYRGDPYADRSRDYGRHAERGRREADRPRQSDYGSSFGPSRFDAREGRGFNSFTGNDQGGADFVAGARRPYGGYGPGLGGYSADYASGRYDAAPHPGHTDRYEDRGFLEKAGDEVASWFGDEDAARRRQMDHRGRGPANYTRSDERILEDVCDALTDDRELDARNIQVTVKDGEVTLDGTIANRFEKRRAEDRADWVSGVNHVQNNLRVSVREPRAETGESRSAEG